MSRRRWITLILSIVIIVAITGKVIPDNQVIGFLNPPGLLGELLFQENLKYNILKWNFLSPYKTELFNYPHGQNLGFAIANSLHLWLYLPIWLIFDTTQSYNVLVLIISILNFYSFFILSRYLFKSYQISAASSLVFALNPYLLLKLNSGFIQKYLVFWIPVYVIFLIKSAKKRNLKYLLLSAASLCLLQLTYPPYAVSTVIFTSVVCLFSLIIPGELQFKFSQIFIILFFFVLMISSVYLMMGVDFNYLFENMNISEVIEPDYDGQLNLFNLFYFHPYTSSHLPTQLPLGLPILVTLAGLAGALTTRGFPRILLCAFMVFVILAAGTYLFDCSKNPVILGGHLVPLPFYLLYKYVPFVREIKFAIRFFPIISLCLALLSGYCLQYLQGKFKRINPSYLCFSFMILIIIETRLLYSCYFPPPINPVSNPDFFTILKNHRKPEAILNIPISTNRHIINLYGYLTFKSNTMMLNAYFNDSASLDFPDYASSTVIKKRFIEQLSRWKVSYIVVFSKFLNPTNGFSQGEEYHSWLQNFCERINYPDDQLVVYKVPEWENLNPFQE